MIFRRGGVTAGIIGLHDRKEGYDKDEKEVRNCGERSM
jgi:hypothetical protein